MKGDIDYFNDSPSLSKVILYSVGIIGLVGMAFIAPNAIQLLDLFKRKQNKKYHHDSAHLQYGITAAVKRLVKERCIKLENHKDGVYAKLTPKGKERLNRGHTFVVPTDRQGLWDGKWRVIIFDVKEERRIKRDKLRRELLGFGFMRLQRSVWIYPYECEDIIAIFKTDQKLWGDVLYMVVEKIEHDLRLRKMFNVSV